MVAPKPIRCYRFSRISLNSYQNMSIDSSMSMQLEGCINIEYIQKHEYWFNVCATWGLHSSVNIYKKMRSLIHYGAKWLTTSMIQLYCFQTISIQVMPSMHTCQNKRALYQFHLEIWFLYCDWYINAFVHPAFNVECILQPPLPLIQCTIKVFSTPPWCRDVQRPS